MASGLPLREQVRVLYQFEPLSAEAPTAEPLPAFLSRLDAVSADAAAHERLCGQAQGGAEGSKAGALFRFSE